MYWLELRVKTVHDLLEKDNRSFSSWVIKPSHHNHNETPHIEAQKEFKRTRGYDKKNQSIGSEPPKA